MQGLDPEKKGIEFNPIDKAQGLLDKSGAVINHKRQDKAFYNKATDSITLPLKEMFNTPEAYYKTALHELGHWTGHESRMNRNLTGSYGSENYAREELVAEMTSFMLGTQCGLGHEPDDNNIAYLKSWAKSIRQDSSYLYKAVRDTDRAAQFILDREKDLTIQNKLEQEVTMKKQEPVIYIKVPIEEKEEAKSFGARWDKNKSCWFIPSNKDAALFDKWEKLNENNLKHNAQEKYFIAVPYSERNEAKKLGAEWDNDAKSWYCHEAVKEHFQKWDVKNISNNIVADIPLSVEEEFLSHIKSFGVLENDVIADGNKHRISVEGYKGKEQSGFYVLHSDGVPNGYFMNNRTGEETKWLQKGYTLSPEEKERMKAMAQSRKAEREQADKERTEKAEKVLFAKFKNQEPVKNMTYFENKNIGITKNVYSSMNDGIAVPLFNIEGRLKSVQYIQPDGSKRFAKDTNKVGAFHIIDGVLDDLKKTNTIIIAEGYATANTISEATNKSVPVITSMGVTNLEPVIKSIKEKYPDMKIVIAADNDFKKDSMNVGLNTAKGIAGKYNNTSYVFPSVNGKIISSDFNDIVSKKGLSKADAFKNIKKSFKSVLENTKDNSKDNKLFRIDR